MSLSNPGPSPPTALALFPPTLRVQHHQQPSSHTPITIPPKWHLALALALSEGIMLVGNTIKILMLVGNTIKTPSILNSKPHWRFPSLASWAFAIKGRMVSVKPVIFYRNKSLRQIENEAAASAVKPTQHHTRKRARAHINTHTQHTQHTQHKQAEREALTRR